MAEFQFKFGRKPAEERPALAFSSILKTDASQIPPHPATDDDFNIVRDWQMLGNDRYGDCVAVTWANERHAINKILLGNDSYATQDQVYSLYKTQNPNFPADDNGMYIQQCLDYLVKSGGPDGVKALAFAKVDHTNLDEIKAAIAIFGMVWVGINVYDNNMSEFNNNQPWDFNSQSNNVGGHSVVCGGYLSNTLNDVQFITWARETGFTDNFWTHAVDEAWVVIWPEHLGTKQFQEGVDLAALANAYTEITGRPFPVDVPTPTPEPTPEPASVTKTFTPEAAAALEDWANYPHVWRKATKAAKAWHSSQ